MSVDQIELELARLPHYQQDRIAAYLVNLRSQRENQAAQEKRTTLEKLRLMEELWFELSSHEEEMDVPNWHLAALAETEREIQSGELTFLPWNEAKESIRRQVK